MNIVVLDGLALNPGDLSWDDLKELGNCNIYERSDAGQIIARCAAAEIVLTNKVSLDRHALEQLPRLKFICVTATGTNNVDIATARKRGVVVSNVPAYGTISVAQTVFALLLEMTHRVGHHARETSGSRWSGGRDWCFWDGELIELAGLNFGVVGFGKIGQSVARVAEAFGMNVLVHTSRPAELPPTIRPANLETLFRESDVVSLHCPLTPETERLVSRKRLALMKPGAFLVNTSRGPLVDEQALADSLNAGRLAGAGLDVLSCEPPPPDHPLLRARNCYITPHYGWATLAARKRLMGATIRNVRAFIAGEPINVV